ncbi:MAG: reverse transcriptase/maturase family protein [Marinoscillum sp.]
MSLYTEDIWKAFTEKVEQGFKLKTYPHFDPFFDFKKRKSEIKKLVNDPTGNSVSKHSFLPFVKIIIKTPRFRYQETDENRDLSLTAKERQEYYEADTKKRPISFASHFDTYLYGFYSYALNEKYQDYIKDRGFGDCVLAYRTDQDGKSNIQFAKETFDEVRNMFANGPCTAIALDIKGYFDSINHDILKEKWIKVLNETKVIDKDELPIDQYKVFRSLTNYSYANKNSILKHFNVNLRKKKRAGEYWQSLLDLIPNELAGKDFKDKFNLIRKRKLIVKNKPKKDGSLAGIPQGSSMSATLANLYLIDFDHYLNDLATQNGFIYRRYCDDLLIICPSDQANDLEEIVQDKIKKYRVEIQPRKTEKIEFKENSKDLIRAFNRKRIEDESVTITVENEEKYYKSLQYLGFEFNGQDITVRASSLSRYFRKMKGRITKTVMMARGKNSKSDIIFRKQLYHRYTHLGQTNFLSYAYKASRKTYKNSEGVIKEGMDSKAIRRQLKAHFAILRKELKLTDEQIGGQDKL